MAIHTNNPIPRPRHGRAPGTTTTEFALSVRLARLERLAKRDAHVEAGLRSLKRALGLDETVL
jgi:hypothetical protein